MIDKTVRRTIVAAIFAAGSLLSSAAIADDSEIVDRVKPVGNLVILTDSESAKPADTTPATSQQVAAAPATANAGKATYDTACFACHGTGAAGAPVLGNKDAWTTRISQGNETLYSHAIDGFKAMPAKGGAVSLSDEEVKVVVDYMVEQSS